MAKPPLLKTKLSAPIKKTSSNSVQTFEVPMPSSARAKPKPKTSTATKNTGPAQTVDIVDFSVVTAGLSQLDQSPGYRGCVDHQSGGVVRGWCIQAIAPMAPVSLEIYLGDLLIGYAATSESRSDISKALRLPVNCGFQFQLSSCASEALVKAQATIQNCIQHGLPVESLLTVRVSGEPFCLPVSPNCRFTNADCSALMQAIDYRIGIATKNQSTRIRNILLDHGVHATNSPKPEVQVVAFYLPQFHPFAENSEWWGEGFTEWTNVTSAKPSFPGHDQPRMPADLGYYDLRVDAVHEKQIDLAKRYGISAFCYHYYWFSGTSLMTLPVNRHAERNYDLDFCLCWANENWSRRWDGSESDVLMAQQHTESDDIDFIHSVIPYFKHSRYIKIDGAPLLVVYRISLLSNPKKVVARWKKIVREAGFPDLHVCMAETFGLDDPNGYAADSSCQFPPHGVLAAEKTTTVKGLHPDFSGKVYDYPDVVAGELRRPQASHMQFRTAMPSWDNTSRKGLASHIFNNSSPEMFEAWMAVLCAKARKEHPSGHRFVFINAWNEWAEGAYLEPDRRLGHDNLNAVRNALSVQDMALGDGLLMSAAPETAAKGQQVVRTITTLANANHHLLKLATDQGRVIRPPSPFVRRPPEAFHQVLPRNDANLNFDNLNGCNTSVQHFTLLARKPMHLSGWLRIPGVHLSQGLPLFLHLTPHSAAKEQSCFISAIHEREVRQDVAAAFGEDGLGQWYGFRLLADLTAVDPGSYSVEMLVASVHNARSVYTVSSNITLHVG
jgi:hypothetical protein